MPRLVFLVVTLILVGCRPARPVPPELARARALLGGPRTGLRPIAGAFASLQALAASAPRGPFAGEVAYGLGICALDLYLLSLHPFSRVPGLSARMKRVLVLRRVPAPALLRFAKQVFTVARDLWQGERRERAERALELTALRERIRGVLDDLEAEHRGLRPPPKNPLRRFLLLDALRDQQNRFLKSAGYPELVERAVLLQRVTYIALLRYLKATSGCPTVAFLAKALLGRSIEAEQPVARCYTGLEGGATRSRARLVRAAWVKLEEYALDRPRSALAPLVKRLIKTAPPEASRALPRSR